MSAPLTPPECDLQDFPFMPLHVARLRDSDLASSSHPEACWYAVLLWCASWHQLPAASLPDNETILARLCGLGRDLRTFRKHREEAMRGFVLCDDGRLYHPTVAEQAMAAWESKRQQRWRSELARIKKANQRNGTNIPNPTYEQFIAGVSPEPSHPGPGNVPGDTVDCPSGQSVQETETGTETGKLKKEANASSVAGSDVTKAFAEWNVLAGRLSLPIAKTLTPERRKAIRARLSTDGLDGWRDALAGVEASPHCRGENDRSWRADIDFVAQPKSYQRLRERFYGGDQPSAGAGQAVAAIFNGPPALRASLVAERDEDYACRWLDHYCRWRPEDRTLLAKTPAVAAQLTRDLPAWMERSRLRVEVEAANDTPKPDLFEQGEAA